jgi:hypothetical protein
MSAGRPSGKRKGLLRRPAEQVELALPPPPGPTEFVTLEPQWWQHRHFVVGLGCALLLLLALTVAARVASHRDRAEAEAREAEVRMLTLRAASQVRAVRITPNPRSWSAAPDATVPWPDPPELLELYLPVAYSDYRVFAITIDKVDVGRVLDLQRVSVDSNRELRLTLNSSTFGPGEYRLRLQGYTWQGQRVDAGWVRLKIGDILSFPAGH